LPNDSPGRPERLALFGSTIRARLTRLSGMPGRTAWKWPIPPRHARKNSRTAAWVGQGGKRGPGITQETVMGPQWALKFSRSEAVHRYGREEREQSQRPPVRERGVALGISWRPRNSCGSSLRAIPGWIVSCVLILALEELGCLGAGAQKTGAISRAKPQTKECGLCLVQTGVRRQEAPSSRT